MEQEQNMLSMFTTDPLAFSRLPAREQMQVVRDLAGIDIAKLEEAYKSSYEERRFVNRDLNVDNTVQSD